MTIIIFFLLKILPYLNLVSYNSYQNSIYNFMHHVTRKI